MDASGLPRYQSMLFLVQIRPQATLRVGQGSRRITSPQGVPLRDRSDNGSSRGQNYNNSGSCTENCSVIVTMHCSFLP